MMTGKRWIPLVVLAAALALLAGATVWAATSAQEPEPSAPLAPVGTSFTYQGKLEDEGVPVDGSCDMEFRLYDAAVFGRQIGPTIPQKVPVDDGLFTVELDFGGSVFRGSARWLDVKVKCGVPVFTDLGRQELTAVPFALYALDAPWDGLPYAGVVVVAKSGGDFTSVQAAIDSITSADVDNPYLVWIAPGVYEEGVTMAPYVHLQGAGQEATIISSDTPETLYLAAHASIRDLTVLNAGTAYTDHAIFASSSDTVTGTLLANVTVRGQGSGHWSQGITLEGSDTSATLLDVTAHAEGGSDYNYGLKIRSGATAILQGGSFTARGGSITAYAIYNHDAGNTLEATGVFALAENTTGGSRGLYNNAAATLRGGTFAAHGGQIIYGIQNDDGSNAVLEAQSVTAEALDGTALSHGLNNAGGASATLHGGSFTAGGGSSAARGIYSSESGTVLQANGVSALAEDSGYNYGLDCGSTGSAYVTLSVLEGSYKSVYRNDNTEVTHSRLVDGDVSGSGTCVAVSYGTTWYENTCP